MSDAIEDMWAGELVRIDLYRRGHTSHPTGQPAVKLGFTARAVAAAVRLRPGVVLALHPGLLPVAHAAATLTRAESALIGMGIEVWAPMSGSRGLSIRRCGRLLAVSTFTARWMARRAHVEEQRVTVVPLPVDARLARAVDPDGRDHHRGSKPAFVTVSRMVSNHRYKGHFAIARALPLVLEQHPNVRWIVIGEGDDLENLREECERLGVGDAVELRGEVDDGALGDAYREALFHVLPSAADPDASPPTGEGLGLVYLEAAAFGLPSIAAQEGGGALDFVEDNVTGLTVPACDPDALAAAILGLLRDAELRVRLGAAARSRVAERHRPEQFLSTLEAGLTALEG